MVPNNYKEQALEPFVLRKEYVGCTLSGPLTEQAVTQGGWIQDGGTFVQQLHFWSS